MDVKGVWKNFSIESAYGNSLSKHQNANISFQVLGCFCFYCSFTIRRQIWLIV